MSLEKILIVFLDGVGLGDETEANPFSDQPLPFLDSLLDGRRLLKVNAGYSNAQATLLGLDATLGVPGIPQSGTGQTAILTGLNAPELLGKHDGPYPDARLKALLAEHNLFHQLLKRNKRVAYAGAYPDGFHKRLARDKGRLSANTRAAHQAGLKLRGSTDLMAGRAISGMLTNRYWREWGYEVPLLTAEQAGAQLVALANDYDLTFFEFWHTDTLGHKQELESARQVLTLLDAFFAGIYRAFDPTTTLVLIISDHGNLEDLSTKQHTLNDALMIALGDAHRATAACRTTMDIGPLVLTLLA